MTFNIFLILFLYILAVKSQKDDIPLHQLDYNWYVDVWVNNTLYSLVVDTSTTIFTLKFNDDNFDAYSNADNTRTNQNCIFLSVDQGFANFTTSLFILLMRNILAHLMNKSTPSKSQYYSLLNFNNIITYKQTSRDR